MACDGIWDVISNEEAVEFIKEQLEEYSSDGVTSSNQDMYYACMELSRLAHEKGSKDNISVILVCIRNKLLDSNPPESESSNSQASSEDNIISVDSTSLEELILPKD